MKLANYQLILVILFVFLADGCIENEVIDNYKKKTELPANLPIKLNYLNLDSLLENIPTNDSLKQPAVIISDIPQSVMILGVDELVPGISYLPQSDKEKRENAPLIKTKAPATVAVDFVKLEKQRTHHFESPDTVMVLKSIHISFDSISDYLETSSKKGLSNIQNGDTIYPPINFFVTKPKYTRALPFEHNDYSMFDIRMLGEDQELPSSFIRAIVKDNKGVIWFGTHAGGLISYNGQYFGHYTIQNGLSSDMVISLLIDNKNNIWIGTEDGGVNMYDGKTITRYTTKQGLLSNNIQSILQDKKGDIWFTTSGGVSKYNGDTFLNFTVKQGLGADAVTSVFEDIDGNIWFGTFGGGVTKYNPNIKANSGVSTFLTLTDSNGLTNNSILSITQDHVGNMWFGTYGGGASMFDGQNFTNFTVNQGLGNDIILSIIEDSYNSIWFGTFGNGVTRYNGTSFSHYTTSEGLIDNYVRTLFDDDEGNLWVGTDGGGISSIIINSFTHFSTEQGLSNNLVLSIFEDDNNRMWFGTFEGGVLIYDEPVEIGKKGTLTQITTKQGLANNTVAAIFKDSKNNYWFGTYGGGVSKLDGSSLNKGKIIITNYSTGQGLKNDVVRSISEDDKGNIFLGTEGGLSIFNGDKFVTINSADGLGSDKVTCIYKGDDDMWVGTIGGGVSHIFDNKIEIYQVAKETGQNTVWSIIKDNNDVMWFGTNGVGLKCLDGNTFKTLDTDDGLSNNYVFSLITDDNNSLWAGTTRGLNQIKQLSETEYGSKPLIINYGKMDGLKSIDFYTNAALHDSKNRIWWGTSDALSMLDMNKYRFIVDAPLIDLNELMIINKLINFNKLKADNKEYSVMGINFTDILPYSNIPLNLSLPHYLDNLTFRFSATEWSSPNQIRYQYILKNFDKDWCSLTKSNIVNYGNLPSGSYVFQVKAIGKSDKWSSTIEYPFIIRPPLWFTWWAIASYVIFLGLFVWLLIRWRVSLVKKQNNYLENLILIRTKELDDSRKIAEQATIVKSQFIATMSHEIRTPLNAITGLTHLAINASPSLKQSDYLQKINRSANTLLSLINDILDFSKVEAGKMQIENVNFDIEIVINTVIVLNAQLAYDKKLEFVVNISPEVPKQLIGDPLRIGQVITNLVSNAVKFTSAGDIIIQIDVGKRISDSEIVLQVVIKDTGIGIMKDEIQFLFDEFIQADSSITRKYGGTGLGLTISKMLIEMMGGHIWVESELNVGTSFYFDCKVGVQTSVNANTPQQIPDELKSFNFLLCDDNTASLDSLASTLRSYSLNVDTVSTGNEVIKRLSANPYELLIINQSQKGMSGIETILKISCHPKIIPLKTILLTDTEKSSNSLDSSTVTIDDFLQKPSIPSVIIEKILGVFGMGHVKTKSINLDDNDLVRAFVAGAHVLLAEDNEINRQVVYELLSNIGIVVDTAENGEIAVQKAKELSYDLVLMDIHMPVMDGYNAAAHIRKLHPDIPIIAVTADTISTIKSKCDLAGISDIITKPIIPKQLNNMMLNWLKDVEPSPKNMSIANNKNTIDLSAIYIPSLDLQAGINRFGGNVELFVTMLNKFTIHNNGICCKLKKLVNKGEFEKGHLLIHTLKGESGSIGAVEVSELAKEVGNALLDRDLPVFNYRLLKLEESLDKFINEVNDNSIQLQIDGKMNPDTIAKLVDELIKLLSDKNPKAFDVLDKLTNSDIDEVELDLIVASVNGGNVKLAIEQLKKLEIK